MNTKMMELNKMELSSEVMEFISGGNAQENAELKEAVLGNRKLSVNWDFYLKKYGDECLALTYLLMDNIDGIIPYIRKYADNSYMTEGHSTTHEIFLNIIRNY